MSIYLDRLTRIVPPRDASPCGNPAAPWTRAVACNVSTTSVELDNDVLMMTPPAASPGVPGSYGRALFVCQAEGGDIYVLFGAASTVVANSAAVSGNTQCWRVPKDQEREFELDPNVDKWLSPRTINGGSVTATLRYRITSFPSQGQPGSG
jgi:hypothetical protein